MKKLWILCMSVILCCNLLACKSENKSKEQKAVMKILSENSVFPTSVPSFNTVDMNGNEVTEAIFANADITVVNFWATYCTPCVGELSDISKWSDELPKGVQIIGIALDAESVESDEYRLAQEIVKKAGVNYTVLAANGQFDRIIRELVGVPTTVLVDKEGKIIEDPIVGADVPAYKKAVEDYLDENNK